MDYKSILNQVIVLFLIMIVGFFARKKNIIDTPTKKGMSELLLSITMPAMIIVSFNYTFSRDMLIKAGIIFVLSFGIQISLALISKFLYNRFPENEKSVLRFITVFSNCGFMGYPVIGSVYGKIGIFYTAIYNIPFNILVFSLGIMLFTKNKDFKSMRKEVISPALISIFIGIIIFVFSIKLPSPIYKTLDMVGSTTTPLAMIIIGSMIAEMEVKNIFSGFQVYYGSLIRLIISPLAVLFVLKALGYSGMFLGIPVLITAMPAAANTAILAEKYNADSLLASKFVFVTSILSAITIPLIILFL